MSEPTRESAAAAAEEGEHAVPPFGRSRRSRRRGGHVAPAADYLWHSPMYRLTPGAACCLHAGRPSAGCQPGQQGRQPPHLSLSSPSPSPNEYACNLANITTSFSLERTIAAVLRRRVQGRQLGGFYWEET